MPCRVPSPLNRVQYRLVIKRLGHSRRRFTHGRHDSPCAGYATEDNYMQLIVWVAGIVQTALYLDFFYNYINAKQKGIDAPIELPA